MHAFEFGGWPWPGVPLRLSTLFLGPNGRHALGNWETGMGIYKPRAKNNAHGTAPTFSVLNEPRMAPSDTTLARALRDNGFSTHHIALFMGRSRRTIQRSLRSRVRPGRRGISQKMGPDELHVMIGILLSHPYSSLRDMACVFTRVTGIPISHTYVNILRDAYLHPVRVLRRPALGLIGG